MVNVADNNGTTGVTLTPRTVFGTTYDNTASTSYKLVESGSGPVTISDTVSTSAAIGQITINNNGATNGNIVVNSNVTASGANSQISFSANGDITEQTGTLTTNGGASGGVSLAANGPNGVGSCPNPILLNTQDVTGNAPNGNVALIDSSPAVISGPNASNSEWKLTDTSNSASAITFASGSSLSLRLPHPLHSQWRLQSQQCQRRYH